MKVRGYLYLMLFLLAGCSNFGATQLPSDRISYNSSLVRSNEQQALLNIIRLRYSRPAYFLSVNNIVSQFNYSANLDLTVSNNPPPPALLGSGSGSIGYSTAPTITYTPLQGSQYITNLLTPINLKVVYMLLNQQWNIYHIGRLLFQKFGKFDNASVAARPPSTRFPEYKKFDELFNTLGQIEHDNRLLIEPDLKDKADFKIKFTILHYKLLTAHQKSIVKQIGINKKSHTFYITMTRSTPENKALNKTKNVFLIETRSIQSIFNYLSKSIDIPQRDLGVQTREIRLPNGQFFDWRQVTKGIFHIRSCDFNPTNAYVAVRYQGTWFYIANNDFQSEDSLSLLMMVLDIYQGNVKSYLPVFTVS